MLRALLATLFSILVVTSAISEEHAFFGEQDSADQLGRAFAGSYALFAPSQGRDTEDIDKQPCVSAQHGQGKTAVDAQLFPAGSHHARTADGGLPHPWAFSKHVLFLHACAPRAPPHQARS